MSTSTLDPEIIRQLDEGSLHVVVPEEYELPEELQNLPPRRVPEEFYRLKRIRRPFIASWVLIAAFILSVIAGARPFGAPWAQIAFWVMAILGLLGTVGIFTCRRELRYIQDGIAAAGEVLDLQLVPAVEYNGQTMALKHVVSLQIRLSDDTVVVDDFSGLQIGADSKQQANIRVGDMLPIVWLPGRFKKTAKPYAFLNFNHDRVLTYRESERSPVWRKALTGLCVVLMFAVMIANLFLLLWYVPVSMSIPVVTTIGIVGGVVLGGGMVWVIIRDFKRQDRQTAERNRQAAIEGRAIQQGSSHVILTNTWRGWAYWLLIVAGCLLIGGLTSVLWAFGLNQFLDTAPAVDRTIEVLGMKTVDRKARRVKVSFRRVDEAKGEYSKEFIPRDMPDFPLFVGQQAVVEWHEGAFGWQWVGEFREKPKP